MKYTVLHGAKANCGDFYIRDAAINLLTTLTDASKDDLQLVEIVRNNLSEETISTIAETEVAFLAGGPGYRQAFYPDTYPAMQDLLDVTTVVPLGPGWKGQNERTYKFTEKSSEILQNIANQSNVPYLGARDLPTVRILRNHDLPAKLTGCPGWYYQGETPPTPQFDHAGSVQNIITSSPPKYDVRHLVQWFTLIRALENEFPRADLTLAFHRSESNAAFRPVIGLPTKTPTWRNNAAAVIYGLIIQYATYQEHETWDIPADSTYGDRYADTDLHVGYRVHAHIPSLASGTPSFLLQIDGRGTGVSESLGTPADVRSDLGRAKAVNGLVQNIDRNFDDGFSDFQAVSENIKDSYDRMEDLIATVVS